VGKFSEDDDALLAELGVDVEPAKASSRTSREERIIAGFEDIQRFVAEHGRAPFHGEDRDIFERLYAVRLDRLRELAECRALLEPLDHQGLLAPGNTLREDGEFDDDRLLAELGVEDAAPGDITELRHVRSTAEKRAAEEIGSRQPCADFEVFKPFFASVQNDLVAGLRETRRFERKSEIEAGRFYILGGQKLFVAASDEPFTNDHGNIDARLRLIFDNGTESNILMRSLQRALQQDPTGRRIIEAAPGPLFADRNEDGDEASGTIYVLRSKSDMPEIAAHRELIHKIGVTGADVEARIANARYDATYLLAEVEIVATYKLFNINRTKLENIIHRVFAAARLDLEIQDRFGHPVKPREWFLVPLAVIADAVDKIKDGTILGFEYDPRTASLKKAGAA
jgi:hypothetical protein